MLCFTSLTTLLAQEEVIIYDKNGKPLYVKDQIIVCFRPELLNKATIDNIEKQKGTLIEFINPVFLEIAKSSDVFNASLARLKVQKIFHGMKTTDSISRTRLGERIRMPKFWSTLLIHWENSGTGLYFLQAIDKLNQLKPYIDYAEPNYVSVSFALPNDTRFVNGEQSGLHPTPTMQNASININPAWDLTTGKNSVRVGIIDSGVNWDHEDMMDGNVFGTNASITNSRVSDATEYISATGPTGYAVHDMDDTGHGSAAASVIGAVRNNERGVAGIAGGNGNNDKGVKLCAQKIMDSAGTTTAAKVASALRDGVSSIGNFAMNEDIMNLSWGGPTQVQTERKQIEFAFENQVLVVVASGNDGNKDIQNFPASFNDDWVLKVGGSDGTGALANFSVTGFGIDLIAPGTDDTYAAIDHNTDDTYTVSQSGTSISAPHVSGAAALMLSYKPNLAPEDIENLFQRFADDIVPNGYDNQTGFGKLNIGNALQGIRSPKFEVKHYSAPITKSNVTKTTKLTNVLVRDIHGALPVGNYSGERFDVTVEIDITQPTGRTILDVWKRSATSDLVTQAVPVEGIPSATLVSWNQNKAVVSGSVFHFTSNVAGQSIDEWIPFKGFLFGKAQITVYSDDKSITNTLTTSIDEERTRIVPNPSNGEFKIMFTLQKSTNLGLQILDMNGRVVHATPSFFHMEGHKEIDLDLNHLPKGVYVCNLVSNENNITKKIIIR